MNDHVFKAMADPTRRKILDMLKGGPKTAGEISDAFASAQPTISRHLAILKHADLVVGERQGSFIVYHLNTTVLQSWIGWLLRNFGGDDRNES